MPRIVSLPVIASFALAACGGGGSSSSPPVPDALVGGYWEGTLEIEGEGVSGIIGLVAENGQGHFLRDDGVQYWGTLTTAERRLTATVTGAAPFGSSFPDGSASGTGSIEGTVIPRTTLGGTLDFTTTGATSRQGEMSLFFDSIYGRRSSLVTVAGNYTSVAAPGSDSLNISSTGTVFGQSPETSCVINGQVKLIAPEFNAYDIRVSYSGCEGDYSILNGSSFGGLGLMDNRTAPERLVAPLQGTVSGQPMSVPFIYERT